MLVLVLVVLVLVLVVLVLVLVLVLAVHIQRPCRGLGSTKALPTWDLTEGELAPEALPVTHGG